MDRKKDIKKEELSWASFEHEGRTIKGYFEKLEENSGFIKLRATKEPFTIFTIPWARINLVKGKEITERRQN